MRLGLAKDDYIRTQIISKKISKKFFEEAGTEVLPLEPYFFFYQFTPIQGTEALLLSIHASSG